ncbi:NAD(P)-dependent alcohol dehydrogenase [Gracilimonas mengyeensis]|nr:NAD(P)-dependent alcohol dehydrogenase [Gracilimonas mengyeensis]
MKTMKSIIYEKYGGPEVLQLMQSPIPEPGSGELLIKVNSSSVTAADWHLRKADPFMVRIANGFFKPKQTVLGQEFAGEVVKVGAGVTNYSAGDKVFGSTGMKTGAYAEYITVDENSVLGRSPKGIDQELLATVPIGAMTAQFFLSQGNLKSGSSVLVNGASGSVGSYAVQIAKAAGAHVTGICSTSNVEWVKEIGADTVIDYKTTDFTRSNQQYDIIFDTVGNLSFRKVRDHLTDEGHFISTAFNIGLMFGMMGNALRKGKKVFTGITKETKESLEEVTDMIRKGVLRPVIDRSYSMEEIQEAHRYVESGRKKGNVLLTIHKEGSYERS